MEERRDFDHGDTKNYELFMFTSQIIHIARSLCVCVSLSLWDLHALKFFLLCINLLFFFIRAFFLFTQKLWKCLMCWCCWWSFAMSPLFMFASNNIHTKNKKKNAKKKLCIHTVCLGEKTSKFKSFYAFCIVVRCVALQKNWKLLQYFGLTSSFSLLNNHEH